MSVEAGVIEIIAEFAEVSPDSVTPEKRLNKLNIDSIAMAEALFAIEERFDIQITFNANTGDAGDGQFKTVGDVIAEVQRLVDAEA